MEKKETKKMCISAEYRRMRKTVTFPVPAEMVEWMNSLSEKKAEGATDGAQTFVVDGDSLMGIRISIVDYGERF